MHPLDPIRLGQRLQTARERATMLQKDAAHALGITPSALSQYESGRRRIDTITLDRLARLYGTPVIFFFDGNEEQTPDWESRLRALASELGPAGKEGIGLLITRIHALEELYEHTGEALPGEQHHPFAPLPAKRFADYEVQQRAEQARQHYALGYAPMHNMKGFLEAHGYLVFAIALSQEPRAPSGLYFRHSDLGSIAVINEDQAYTRWPFTLAHELAHGLFHYDRGAILCRYTETNVVEAFANEFAGQFLIPQPALHEQLHYLGRKTISEPEDVVKLARYFGVSFGAMRWRLNNDQRLSMHVEPTQPIKPVALAKSLGYAVSPYEFNERPLPLEVRFPQEFLRLAYQAVRDGSITLRRAADLLGVSHLDLEDRLSPENAPEEREEEPV